MTYNLHRKIKLQSPGTLKKCVHGVKNKNEEIKEINTSAKVNKK